MTATVASTKTGHGDKPLHTCGLHGIDQDARGFREESCAFEDQPRREVHTEGLDHHVDVPKYVPDRVGIERVARYLIEVCILDLYAPGRTRQGTNAVPSTKRGPCRFESDAVAGTYDKNLGQNSPKSYLFSTQ